MDPNPLLPDGYDVVWTFLAIGIYVITLAAFVRIIQKAGYSGWWVLVGLVPVLNVVMFFVFAFGTWPVTRELEAVRVGSRQVVR
ncbi:hypothetical protein [Cellulomonas sp. HZM]|uniref:DUF805 domain-containing protein n=1 Tax=Cellulomonas sp. HZM TaxID=1454010 RepID=UPI000AA1618A|nr:hypothetical protein [Cellulomonas sp. HZM]